MHMESYCMFNSLFLFMAFFIVSGEVNSSQILNDEASLLSFKSRVVYDPNNSLENWNSSKFQVCNWSGIGCNVNKTRVLSLDLSGLSLRGTISPAISKLSYLKILDLSKNFFEGHIPAEIGSLFHLKELSLSTNLLEGTIPRELGSLGDLVYLDLGSNRLSGEIPKSLLCNATSSLEYLDLSNNSISGEIRMNNQCQLRQLRFLLLWSNQLVGQVPPALSNSSKLEWLDLESNALHGNLPSEIVQKMPLLQFLYLSYNNFSSHNGNTNLSTFFSYLMNSSNLQELELAGNNLGGEIPSIIGDLPTCLVQLHLENNLIFGSIPPDISKLFNLTLLNLSGNLITGSIPRELCQMKRLERLYLSNNKLSGDIPSAFGDIPHLGLLDLSRNRLSGSIPDSFANLTQVRSLLLYENQLSGTIPPSLGNCINLEKLDLSHNSISGVIPKEVAGLSSLKLYLNLSANNLHGPIPGELGKMDMVLAIDISSNKLSGTIPPQIGSCIALEYLNLSSNALESSLPESLGKLPYLIGLDLSSNNLSGELPESLQASSTLKEMKFSFNNFSGVVLNRGAFSGLPFDSFMGNPHICGSIKGMHSCSRKRIYGAIILPAVISSVFVILILGILGYRLALKLNFKRKLATSTCPEMLEEEHEGNEHKHPKISYEQLIEATGGFSNACVIGSGQFGHVYKGIFEDDTKIAVKVINTKTAGELSGKCFRRECQILKRTRHRNLIKIITTCSRPDFKAIVLPLMPNGSLENYLYPSCSWNHRLDLVQLVNICSDVAEGLAYLHHYSPVKVVHCDLKPSNILLDHDMTALVSDFGIAKLVKESDQGSVCANDSALCISTDGLLCGSLGYMAPEYGMGMQASTEGDVYSYGVLLLESVTGKRPTDSIFQEGSNLHEWVKSQYPCKIEPVLEQALLRYAPHGSVVPSNRLWCDVLLELIELGLMCTQYSPLIRPTMDDVAHEMARLKQYLSGPSEKSGSTKST
ncbi:hypothetical protein DCAR_0522219 [Daucus carota subsp. sativus]|uniref:non-specific serine/threonine protein kinase n=2 Tax=Daucus carota subsp. sativus TaxID=79200 RepID=A0AAF1B4G1_DAUCS|nr:hypothetical protein DCAR_0522216 [Daucus carota subsp. sativus]WOH02829.1 hypothetical protein DCAR_0522219 [Daucus carota subsp. sativus]